MFELCWDKYTAGRMEIPNLLEKFQPGTVPVLVQEPELDTGVGKDRMGLGLEVGFVRLKDILHIGLWVEIDQGKPTALYLDLHFMAFFEGVEHILHPDIH